MILNPDTHPERDIYFIGGKVIEILDEHVSPEIDILEIYTSIKNSTGISFNLFILSLDWLFLLGVINKGTTGGIIKCF